MHLSCLDHDGSGSVMRTNLFLEVFQKVCTGNYLGCFRGTYFLLWVGTLTRESTRTAQILNISLGGEV